MKNKETKEKKKFTILGMTIWKLLAYFIIYSVLGYLIETLFGLVTKGVIESRKSFIYGPFCAIYGVGAVIMIGSLRHFKKNNFTLFFGGFLIGSIVEYFVSLFGEMMLHVKWWDYSGWKDLRLSPCPTSCSKLLLFLLLMLYPLLSYHPFN